jgi:hypothetical protein
MQFGVCRGVEAERGLECRYADSRSLRAVHGVSMNKRVPDYSSYFSIGH